MTTDLVFSALKKHHIPLIEALGWNKPASIYQKYFQEQAHGQRCVWVAFKDDIFVGYVTLKMAIRLSIVCSAEHSGD